MQDFEEYIRQGEPAQREKASTWQTAIGLQDVDGLKPSAYLLDTARRHVEGDITIDEVQQLIKTYYQSKTNHTGDEDDQEEADRAAANITRILSRHTLAFNTNGYLSLHRHIFDGVMKHAGELRPYDITKREWVLNGDTVNYLNYEDLRRAIDYDLEQERQFSYKGLSIDEQVEHIAHFVSGLWQIHAFREGNTRTTAVFLIQYLRSIGFKKINNDMFANHSWYLRNALVRANYKNAQRGVDYDYSFLVKFFRNLLMGEQNELRNRYMHLDYKTTGDVQSATAKVPKEVSKEQLEGLNDFGGQRDKQRDKQRGKQKSKQKSKQKTADRIIDILHQNSHATRKDIATELALSESTIYKNIEKLKAEGKLIRIGGDKGGHWTIVE